MFHKEGLGEFCNGRGDGPREWEVVIVISADSIAFFFPRREDDVFEIVEDGFDFCSVGC